MFYAQLNENSICIGVTETTGRIDSLSMIELSSFDAEKLNRKWENGQWSEIKFDPQTVIPLDEIEKLKAENLELKLALAELAEVIADG